MKQIKEQMIYGIILVVLLCFLGIQIYEGLQTNTIIVSNIVTDGDYIYVDMSKQPLHCDWDNEAQEVKNCVDISEDKVCKYNLDYTFAGECWDKPK